MRSVLIREVQIECSGNNENNPDISFVFSQEEGHLQGRYLHVSKNVLDQKQKIVLGLGESVKLSPQRVKACIAKAMKAIKYENLEKCNIDVGILTNRFGVAIVDALVEGIMLGLYEPISYKKDQKQRKHQIYLCGFEPSKQKTIECKVRQAKNIVESIMLVRDLVNMPSNHLTPTVFADIVLEIGSDMQIEVEVLDESKIQELGMSAFLTVGSSGSRHTRMVVMRYRGNPLTTETTAIVGKGITCDTGGYCLKSVNAMLGIKGDMAGGATVLGVMRALSQNQVKTNVMGVIAICENRLSRESFVPGDVINSMSGKTIEIINTDAEGRLILADSLTYVQQDETVSRIIDIATLTGSVVSTLGFTTAAIVSNNDSFTEAFFKSSEQSGEQYLQLPIYEEYRQLLESDIADIKNIGASYLGTITAGIFLETFVQEEIPWLHIDIAGTAWVDTPVFEYQAKGATGNSVSTLYHFLSKMHPDGS